MNELFNVGPSYSTAKLGIHGCRVSDYILAFVELGRVSLPLLCKVHVSATAIGKVVCMRMF